MRASYAVQARLVRMMTLKELFALIAPADEQEQENSRTAIMKGII